MYCKLGAVDTLLIKNFKKRFFVTITDDDLTLLDFPRARGVRGSSPSMDARSKTYTVPSVELIFNCVAA